MTLDEMRASVRRVLGVDLPLGPPTGEGPHVLRRLTGGNTRLAERFSDRRVFLVGDAAHVYTGGGGPGLNLGLQDAINLGWKLAAEVRGCAPPGLLDSYQIVRRSAARRTIMYAQAQSALLAPGSDVTALRELFTELLENPGVVQHLADLTAGTDIRYDMGEHDAHPLVGRLAPDMGLQTPSGTVRLAELTQNRTAAASGPDRGRIGGGGAVCLARPGRHRRGAPAGPAPAATALLLRPDCYVAWASGSPSPDSAELEALRAAAQRWFGVAERAHGLSDQAGRRSFASGGHSSRRGCAGLVIAAWRPG